jgi:hypothetical protein
VKSRAAAAWIAVASGLTAGAGYPLIELVFACRVPLSEACVWGKAYLPVALAMSLVLLGGLVAGLVYAWLRWWQTSRS